jgi:DNA-binding GntR family transcriptional regulator
MTRSAVLESLNVQATSVLRERILSGDLAPGARVVEVELAEELGISRGTLRAALQQLSFEGLVVQKAFRSTYVASLTSGDVYEIYTLRNALEAMATRISAERITNEGRARLDAVIEATAAAVRSGSFPKVIEADYAFHRCVFEMTRHERLQAHYRMIEPQTRLYMRMFASLNAATLNYDLPQILAIHRDYAEAIKAGDAARAQSLANDHNTVDGERIVALLRSREETQA